MPARRAALRRPAVAALAALALILGGALPAYAADPPSWSDVQNARKSQAATIALVATLQRSLDAAEASAAASSTAALEKAAAAQEARLLADEAAQRAAQLTEQSAAAQADLASRQAQLGMLAAHRYRTSPDGALFARLLTTAEPETLLAHLGLLDKVTGTWAGLVTQAQRAAWTAESLAEQAEAATAARDEAARTAEADAAAAQAAADAEAGTVAEVRAQVDTMYAQLAALKDTTAETERLYRLGQRTSSPAAQTGAGGSSGSSGGSSGGGSAVGSAPTGVSVDPAGAKAYARSAVARYGWGDDQYQCLVLLWNRESGWRADALNRSSGAYGIPQSLPAEKMASAGADWRTNGNTQVEWGLSYIKNRYGSPCGAWDHSERTGWY